MKKIEIKKDLGSLAEYTRRLAEEPVIVTEKGKPIAVLVRIENADDETVSLSNDPKFLAIIERSRARHKKEGGISIKEIRKRLGLNHT
jgi:antitoxin (DNA-binding transcriptional repressor) of toxin-antitoxin stability system